MVVIKVLLSLLTVWILFLTATAFPSLSDASIASTDIQNTFVQQTYSWSAGLAVKTVKLNHQQSIKDYLLHKYYLISESAYCRCFSDCCHIQKGLFSSSHKSKPLSLKSQLLI